MIEGYSGINQYIDSLSGADYKLLAKTQYELSILEGKTEEEAFRATLDKVLETCNRKIGDKNVSDQDLA